MSTFSLPDAEGQALPLAEGSAGPGFDSAVFFQNSQHSQGRGTLVHITRSQVVFEVYNPYSIVQVSEVLPELRIMRGERVIYRGRAVVSNLLNTGLLSIVSTTLVDTWADLSGLRPGEGLREETARFVVDWRRSDRLRPDYRLAVSSLCGFLGELARWLQEAEASRDRPADEAAAEDLIEAFFHEVSQPLAPEVEDLYMRFEEVAAAVPEDELPRHKAFARREMHPLTMCSPFVHRSYNKPLGYAGDYEMVNMMLGESQARAPGAYARIVDAFHVLTAAPEAHRNRIGMLVERLGAETARAVADERPLRVLNVGCGPAVEVQRFIRSHELAPYADFTLMDFNEETLAYAQTQIEAAMQASGRRPAIRFVRRSIDELLQEAARDDAEPRSYDFIYCAGLFDYFSDRVCRQLVQLYASWLAPGGLVSVTNVHARNPNRQVMEHMLEWYLVYRDEAGMAALAPAGVPAEVLPDPTGINLFLDLRRGAGT